MKEVQQILLHEVNSGKTPSVQYYYFDTENVLKKYSFGLADIINNIPVNQNTAYHAYSITKTFTALALLQLAEKEKLSIDDPARKYLPDFIYGDAITIRQILSHAGGIPNPVPLSWIHLECEHEGFNEKKFFKSVIKQNRKAKHMPNKRFTYSNLGYVLLGELVERISGQPYKLFVEENIIKKLDLPMAELAFERTSDMQFAKGYHKAFSFSSFALGLFLNKKKFMGITENGWKLFNNFYVNGTAYGGLIGTPIALVKYIQALLNKDSLLISEKYKHLLFEENILSNGKASGMCLSWFKGQLNGHSYFAHAGGGGGFYCEIRIYPSLGRGSVIFFNRSGMTDERFLDKVDKYLF